jgi:hypothetical protein
MSVRKPLHDWEIGDPPIDPAEGDDPLFGPDEPTERPVVDDMQYTLLEYLCDFNNTYPF